MATPQDPNSLPGLTDAVADYLLNDYQVLRSTPEASRRFDAHVAATELLRKIAHLLPTPDAPAAAETQVTPLWTP